MADMALHHFSSEYSPHMSWPRRLREPRIAPRNYGISQQERESVPFSYSELREKILVRKSETGRGERHLHVTLPPEIVQSEPLQKGTVSVWIGYATQEFLDAPPVFESNQSREVLISDHGSPFEVTLPLAYGLKKPLTVQIIARSGKQELGRYRIEDEEIAREPVTMESEKVQIKVLR